MAELNCADERAPSRIRPIALGVALVWAVWWTSLGLSVSIGWLSPSRGLPYEALVSLIPLLSALIAWQWGAVGGVFLVLEGLLLLIIVCLFMTTDHFPFRTFILVLLTMALPPLVAGYLFIKSWARSREPRMLQGKPNSG